MLSDFLSYHTISQWRRVEDFEIIVTVFNGPCVVCKVECKEKFKWLTAFKKTYKQVVHEVGVVTDGPHASKQIIKMIKKIAFEVSLKLKTKIK